MAIDRHQFDIPKLRDAWYETSWLFDQKQTANGLADERYANYKKQPLRYDFPTHFTGALPELDSHSAQTQSSHSSRKRQQL
jgi:phosphoribosylformylglycinamidine synthase